MTKILFASVPIKPNLLWQFLPHLKQHEKKRMSALILND